MTPRLYELKKLANSCGLDVDTWSPGDGWTRYRIVNQGESYYTARYPYFTGTRKEAEIFLLGYNRRHYKVFD